MIVVHLGVALSASSVRLERRAANEADFRLPGGGRGASASWPPTRAAPRSTPTCRCARCSVRGRAAGAETSTAASTASTPLPPARPRGASRALGTPSRCPATRAATCAITLITKRYARQGDPKSPNLFGLYVDDLVILIEDLGDAADARRPPHPAAPPRRRPRAHRDDARGPPGAARRAHRILRALGPHRQPVQDKGSEPRRRRRARAARAGDVQRRAARAGPGLQLPRHHLQGGRAARRVGARGAPPPGGQGARRDARELRARGAAPAEHTCRGLGHARAAGAPPRRPALARLPAGKRRPW